MPDGAHDHPQYANLIGDLVADVDELTQAVEALTAHVATLETTPPPPPPDPDPDPDPEPTVGDPLRPFSTDSPWNTKAGATNTTLTAAVRAPLKGGGLGINIKTYSVPVYIATASDPLVTIDDPSHGKRLTARVPKGAVPAAGTDSNMAIIQPDGRTIDTWIAKWTNATTLTVQRLGVTSITGQGIGPAVAGIPAGIRAAGCSWIGGLIRSHEVDPAHPDYTDGVIRHALAMSLPATFYKYTNTSGTSADGHLDTSGFGLERGYVWPATEQDHGSQWTYKGTIPLGTRFRIPANVNVGALGLTSAAARAVAKAAQDHGVYVMDKTDNDGWWGVLYGEPSIVDTPTGTKWAGDVVGADWKNLERIRQQLVACS